MVGQSEMLLLDIEVMETIRQVLGDGRIWFQVNVECSVSTNLLCKDRMIEKPKDKREQNKQ